VEDRPGPGPACALSDWQSEGRRSCRTSESGPGPVLLGYASARARPGATGLGTSDSESEGLGQESGRGIVIDLKDARSRSYGLGPAARRVMAQWTGGRPAWLNCWIP
jgi:hypothetical protein